MTDHCRYSDRITGLVVKNSKNNWKIYMNSFSRSIGLKLKN
jgi:hypothetical protein